MRQKTRIPFFIVSAFLVSFLCHEAWAQTTPPSGEDAQAQIEKMRQELRRRELEDLEELKERMFDE